MEPTFDSLKAKVVAEYGAKWQAKFDALESRMQFIEKGLQTQPEGAQLHVSRAEHFGATPVHQGTKVMLRCDSSYLAHLQFDHRKTTLLGNSCPRKANRSS